MRFLLSAVLIALILSVSLSANGLSILPSANAGEVTKIKERRQQPETQQVQSKGKQPPDTPRDRPPDKYHPPKERPDNRPPDTRPPQPPPPPPQPRIDPPSGRRDWRDDTWCPPLQYYEPIETPPDYVPPPPPQVVELRDVLLRRLRLMEIEGFEGQVAVGWDGELYFEQTCGEKFTPMGGRDKMYDIAGVTRAFTAWAMYNLIDSKKLTLWTTLGELFPNAPADKQRITIEQLLANTSGLGNTWAADGEADRDTAVSNLLAQPLAHAPGVEFTYSDDGYVILAAVIEVASRMAYESYLMDSDVVSADMKNTAFWTDAGPSSEEWGQRGSGGILSTATDLYQWTSRFLAGPEQMVEEITRPRLLTEADQGIAYGWFWTNPESDSPILWTRGTGFRDQNVMVVVYPSNAILVVTSDEYNGDVPWSERVVNTLEPVLIHAEPPASWVVGYQYPTRIQHPTVR